MYCRFMSLTEKLGIPCRYFWYTQKKLYIFCRVQIISVGIFFNTQENYEKKSTRQNLPQSEHPAPSENPKNPVQRQKEKKRPTART